MYMYHIHVEYISYRRNLIDLDLDLDLDWKNGDLGDSQEPPYMFFAFSFCTLVNNKIYSYIII